ncbi:MAG: hypothetical protein WBQ94_21710, partial [Terracidiphilus sp.]
STSIACMLLAGCFLYDADGNAVDLCCGGSMIVMGKIEHQATALEDSEVLDGFAPYREDHGQ